MILAWNHFALILSMNVSIETKRCWKFDLIDLIIEWYKIYAWSGTHSEFEKHQGIVFLQKKWSLTTYIVNVGR